MMIVMTEANDSNLFERLHGWTENAQEVVVGLPVEKTVCH